MNANQLFIVTALLSVTLMTSGCGKWPEIVNSKKDILSSKADLSSVRARGLPDSDVPFLARFNNLSYLDFTGGAAREDAPITDRGLGLLSQTELPKLETLSLGYCQNITDDGLSCIASNRTIRWLCIMGCQKISDKGLAELIRMTQLETLDLRGCLGVSDIGLSHLGKMTNLKSILLGGTNITSDGMKVLQKSLPYCHVEKDEAEWQGHRDEYIHKR